MLIWIGLTPVPLLGVGLLLAAQLVLLAQNKTTIEMFATSFGAESPYDRGQGCLDNIWATLGASTPEYPDGPGWWWWLPW